MFNECEHKIFEGVNVNILNSFLGDSRIERRSFKKGEVKIVGEGLKIKKYGEGEVALVGKIAGVCYL